MCACVCVCVRVCIHTVHTNTVPLSSFGRPSVRLLSLVIPLTLQFGNPRLRHVAPQCPHSRWPSSITAFLESGANFPVSQLVTEPLDCTRLPLISLSLSLSLFNSLLDGPAGGSANRPPFVRSLSCSLFFSYFHPFPHRPEKVVLTPRRTAKFNAGFKLSPSLAGSGSLLFPVSWPLRP